MTVSEWQRQACARLHDAQRAHGTHSDSVRIDVDVLMCHVLQQSRAWLFAHAHDPLEETAQQHLNKLVTRRAQGEPIAYLTGYREFRSRHYCVTPAVLVPRDDTETLVDAALHSVAEVLTRKRHCCIVEPGSGSGIVATSLALETDPDRVRIVASDIDAAALSIARKNAIALNADVAFLQADWLTGIAARSVDVIASNPPYIAHDDRHLADLGFEPQLALVSGADGLDAIRMLIDQGRLALVDNGSLLFEHGHDQAQGVAELFAKACYEDITHHRDLAGHLRVTSACMRR